MAGQQHSDPTFRKYSADQAANYAKNRYEYSSNLFDYVLAYHDKKSGKRDLLVDVGCGPGNSTRSFSANFTRTVGLDPSPSMIAAAQPLADSAGAKIEFAECAAESIDQSPLVPPGSVDVLTAGTASHWFDMPPFWRAAARALKPGGTVALWTGSSLFAHPDKTPNVEAVQAIFTDLERHRLAPFEVKGNRLTREMYENLEMPWQAQPPVEAFPEALSERRIWNREGKLEPGASDYFGGSHTVSLAQLQKSIGTASMVTRWREKYPEQAHQEGKDIVMIAIREVQKAMGAEDKSLDEVMLTVSNATVLLLFTKSG